MKSLASARLKRVRALELLAEGLNYDQIAKEVGFTNRGSAHRAVTRALSEREIEGVDHLRALELERLDRLYSAFWHQAMRGDIEAARVLLAVSAQRRRFYGLEGRRKRVAPLYEPAVLVQPELEGNPRGATSRP